MRDLLAGLSDHPMAMLRGIADLHGLALSTNVREDVAAQLAAALAAPGALEAALAAVSEPARAAWAALAAAGGHLKVPAFTRNYGTIRPAGPGRLEREQTWRQPVSPAEELWYRGLIFRAFANLGGGPAEYFYIPAELLGPLAQPVDLRAGSEAAGPAAAGPAAGLPVVRPSWPPLAPLAATAAPAAGQQAGNSLAVDLCTLLMSIREAPLRLEGGRRRAGDEARLRQQLLLRDPVRFELLLGLATDLGWLAAERGRLDLQPGSGALTAWLRSAIWQQMTALFAAWRDSVNWNDLRHLPSLRAEGEWRNDPRLPRQALLALLGQLQPGAWFTVSSLVAWFKEHEPDFQRPDSNYTGWYLRDIATDRYLSGFECWDDVEGRLLYFLVCEALHWLGAIELGTAAGGEERAFRLTPAGAAWLAGEPPPPPEALAQPGFLVAGEDFVLLAPPALPLADRARLMRFTELEPGPAEPRQPTRHRITRRSLLRAREAGLDADRLLQFLQRTTGGQVPPQVAAGLERWEQHGGDVRVSQGAVLRVDDASVLAALRADPVIRPLLGELLSAQAVLVSAAHLPRLLTALAELGYNARVD